MSSKKYVERQGKTALTILSNELKKNPYSVVQREKEKELKIRKEHEDLTAKYVRAIDPKTPRPICNRLMSEIVGDLIRISNEHGIDINSIDAKTDMLTFVARGMKQVLEKFAKEMSELRDEMQAVVSAIQTDPKLFEAFKAEKAAIDAKLTECDRGIKKVSATGTEPSPKIEAVVEEGKGNEGNEPASADGVGNSPAKVEEVAEDKSSGGEESKPANAGGKGKKPKTVNGKGKSGKASTNKK